MQHVVSGLLTKRAEIAGSIQHYRDKISSLSEDLKYVDGVIRLFDPTLDLSACKPKKHRVQNTYFKPGECHRLVLDMLRQAGKELATGEVRKLVEQTKQLALSAEESFYVEKSIYRALATSEKKGLVRRFSKEKSRSLFWELT